MFYRLVQSACTHSFVSTPRHCAGNLALDVAAASPTSQPNTANYTKTPRFISSATRRKSQWVSAIAQARVSELEGMRSHERHFDGLAWLARLCQTTYYNMWSRVSGTGPEYS